MNNMHGFHEYGIQIKGGVMYLRKFTYHEDFSEHLQRVY